MNRKVSISLKDSGISWFRLALPLLALLAWGNAWGTIDDRDIGFTCPPPHPPSPPGPCTCTPLPPPGTQGKNPATYNAKVNQPVPPADRPIAILGARSNVTWLLSSGNSTCNDTHVCAALNLSVPTGSVANSENVMLTGTPTNADLGKSASFTLTVADSDTGIPSCDRQYKFSVTSTGGGWGDPHINTVDGVNYDFQSAGEFTSLRSDDGLEIQTRQTPVATSYLPGANAYTGIPSCVSLYTAVAARVGSHRVSYQPNISGVPDPSGLQLRVDGVLTALGPDGINLASGGRIVKSAIGGGIEIHYVNGTKLVVTPDWWDAQKKWYLNVNVYDTAATEGIMGKLANGSWLPALPDGTSLGPKPDSIHQRYQALYDRFGNAWRVTDATSLFDYAPGTSTATFTRDDWPRESPASCAIEGEPMAQPLTALVAKEQCSAIADRNNRANCEFDVLVTGNPGFDQTYQVSEQLRPGATITTVKDDHDPSQFGENVTFTATVAQAVPGVAGIPAGKVQFILDGGNAGSPLTLGSTGQASWSSSSLQVGNHRVSANYVPIPGGPFLSSNSPDESHTVTPPPNPYLWLIVLLLVILILIIIWGLLR